MREALRKALDDRDWATVMEILPDLYEQGKVGLVDEGWLESECADLAASLDLRVRADMRAIKMWQEAHPDRQDIWPDHADMVVWLMDKLVPIEWWVCVWCDTRFPYDDGPDTLKAHSATCPKHPAVIELAQRR